MTKIDLEPLKEYAATLVAVKIEQREAEGKAPIVAFLDEMLVQVKEDFLNVMREHVKSGLLKCGKTLNGNIMFEFTPPK